MKTAKKVLKTILDILCLLLSGGGEWAEDAVRAGAVDFSGQGRDKFGN